MKYYIKRFIYIFILLFGFSVCRAQHSSFYQNFVLANERIYVLHADSTVKIFDDNTGKVVETYALRPQIKMLLQDHNGNVIIVDSKNSVKKLTAEKKWVTVASCAEDKLFGVAFNNDNDCFLITRKGILNVNTQKEYLPGRELYHSESALSGREAFQSADNDMSTYVDKDNNLWVYFGHGEWGSDMFIFDTKKSTFTEMNGWITPPFYEANNHLFSVISDFHDTYIVQYDKLYDNNKVISLFKGKEVYKTSADYTYPGGPTNFNFSIGAFTFNKADESFYFITSKGLNKINPSIRSVKLFGNSVRLNSFIYPKSSTKAYEFYDHQKKEIKFENAYPQSVSKLQFTTKGKLVMLAPWNGVWLFDGKKLIILE